MIDGGAAPRPDNHHIQCESPTQLLRTTQKAHSIRWHLSKISAYNRITGGYESSDFESLGFLVTVVTSACSALAVLVNELALKRRGCCGMHIAPPQVPTTQIR
ncbi:hypothetical protein, unlikely [Trypanosoma brucei gambiense DAL972]|uniref:Uncharacterized protein n=1 Tax=Trypanosoma brucei gambiense (strain MHOM/CI/86/DAL972) TaxID=679716 RepID=C9ZIV2_TRYB9|nr:hypothetical protein, unlikely [Trypanosoma brucei gambiense DAL972]CBH09318.1 hypothetical protein, unlikely [Trypanosoma brucei gambiense DAL972]|eukprot:XP_011771626.1 hypothetical protein, unlikely [Trypanosoma brucei gambiense DAL972]